MGWLTKEEYYSKKKGKFVPKEQKVKELTREEQFEKRKPFWHDPKKAEARAKAKMEFTREYEKSRRKATLARARREGKRAGSMSPTERLGSVIGGIGGPPPKRRPPSVSKGRKKRKRKPPTRGGDIFGDWDIV